MENKIDENDLKKELFERIEKLSNPYDPIEESNENINTKIKWGSNWIATVGRFGYATHLLISKENYEKHEIDSLYLVSDVDPIKINPPLLTIVFSDNVKDCILYRINSFDQPGLVLVHNNDKYSFESIGFYPENQFLRILLK